MWIDTHCHLPSLEMGAEAALEGARAANVSALVCVATDVASSEAAIALAAEHPDVWATVGLHPHDATDFEVAWPRLLELAETSRVVAIGETGLDFHYNFSPAADQLRAFRAHVRLAHELDRALVVHTRDAWDALFEVFEDLGVPDRTVLHCFTGGPEELEAAVALGCAISFSGIISFKNADDIRAAARLCPPDRMLVETDAPYLAPVPHRGQENRPAYVAEVGHALAAAREETPERIAALTAANARRVFALDDPR